MKNFTAILLVLILALSSISQEPTPEPAKDAPEKTVSEEKTLNEKEEFQNALAKPSPPDRVSALQKFLEKYPESKLKTRALEIIASSRAEIADEKLRLNEAEKGIELFKLAVSEAPVPVSDKFFSRLLVKFPANLFFRGQRSAAVDVARMIEQKIADNPTQLLGLATFYLSIEQASEAKRLANRSIELEPESATAYHTLGFAHRLDFDLENASESFSKALELDPDSLKTKSSLAEMKRALGKPDEALTLYREILEAEPGNSGANTGLVLSLFDSGNREEAEKELTKTLEANPQNLSLLVGAAYWYAARGEGVKAAEVARQAVSLEPRYTWGYIALARGLLSAGDPMAAERTLLTARQFGNFPTLSYELAAARFAAGFYQEAAEGLKENFDIEDGLIKTKLGGRVEKSAVNFQDLLANERRASIFQYTVADRNEDSGKLKVLLDFARKVESSDSEDSEIETIADEFIAGDDSMKFHRQIFVANQLLNKKKALGKVLTITEEAVSGVDSALTVSTPSAAVLADELYTSRKIALSRGESIIVPNIPKQTLSKIVRGRIEEISGWTLFQQDKPEPAISRLKLAVSVLPADSAWSRSSYWKLGTVLESVGKQKEALDAYIRGYSIEEQNSAKKIVIENIYTKINGSLEGFEARLQSKPPKNDAASLFMSKPSEEEKDEQEKPKDAAVNDAVSQDALKEVKADENELAEKPDKKPVASAIEEISLKEPAPDTKAGQIKNTELIVKIPPAPTPSENNKAADTKNEPSTADTILDPKTNISELSLIPEEDKPVGENVDKPQPAAPFTEPVFEPIIIRVPEAKNAATKLDNEKNAQRDEQNKTNSADAADSNPDKTVGAQPDKKPQQDKPSESPAPEKPDEKTTRTDEVKGDEKPKADKSADNPPAEKPNEKPVEKPAETDEVKLDEKPQADESENNPSGDKPEEKPAEKKDAPNPAPLERPRIVNEEKPPKEAESCKIFLSQESVSIINSGGSIGVLIGLEEGKGDSSNIKASSSSPKDVEVVLEPEIGTLSERAFFVVRSISEKLGVYEVLFETPCGKKTVKVNVR